MAIPICPDLLKAKPTAIKRLVAEMKNAAGSCIFVPVRNYSANASCPEGCGVRLGVTIRVINPGMPLEYLPSDDVDFDPRLNFYPIGDDGICKHQCPSAT